MFFVASATIAAEHPELEAAVRTVDEHLFRHAGHPLRADITSELLGIEPGRLTRLMALFAEKGVVTKLLGYTCPWCDHLIEHVPGEGDLWCDECEESVTLRGRGDLGVVMWQTLPAVPTTGPSPPESVPATEVCVREKVCIQFIGGDRGGATRPQLMLPREEKDIRDAVNLGMFRDRFAFSDPVHAASVDDVIACHRFNPGIVHFAGHGEERRLILVQDRDLIAQQRVLTADQLVTLFRNYPTRVTLVFLNACHSADLARGLADSSVVDMAIGVPGQLADDPAIFFARTFYRQLSDGLNVRQAFEMAGLQHPAGAVRHELFAADGVSPGGVAFRS